MNHLTIISILGYPRSGTTWFANLFNSHPDVVYRHEMIGRCYKDIPEPLFKKLKSGQTLTEGEYEHLVRIVLSPNVESDRAPFFRKNHLVLNYPTIHYFGWIFCKSIPLFHSLYKYMFYPKGPDLTLVLKETRSTTDMDNILKGLRSDTNIILFRHPCGTIASSLNGIKTGKMQSSSREERERWFNFNKDREYLNKINLNSSNLADLPEHEYLALLWRVQNEDYLEFSTSNSIYISYENFMTDQEAKVKQLFTKLSLSYDTGVHNFILASSGNAATRPRLIDSPSNFYSVYRSGGFKPDRWKDSLKQEEISAIEKHTIEIFNTLSARSTC